jgi:hypothetical protein
MIIQAIDDYLQTRPRDKRDIHCFHPSSLHRGEDYLLNHYLHGDVIKAIEPRVLRIFDNGHGVHRRLQRYLKDIGILLQDEVRVENKEYEIIGHTDGILKINGHKGILEIKSMNVSGFYSLFEPKPEHLVQMNVYMYCSGIDRAVLLVECKDGQQLKEFYIQKEPEILNSVLAKIKRVQARIHKIEGKNGQNVSI